LLALIFVWANLRPLAHREVWVELALGRWIVHNGGIPETEPFSPYSAPASMTPGWLTRVVYHGVFQAGARLAGGDELRRLEGGIELLRDFHALLTLVRFLLLMLALWRLTGSLPLGCAGVALSFAATFFFGDPQSPRAVGEALFAGLLLILSRPVLSGRGLLAVPLLLVLWANAESHFLAGLLLVTVCLLGKTVEAGYESGAWSARQAGTDPGWRRLLAALILAVLATFLNPDGPGLYRAVWRQHLHPNLLLLAEGHPLDFSTGSVFPWVFLGTLVVLTLTQACSPQSFSVTQSLLAGVFALLVLLRQSMIDWWLLLLPWLAAPHWLACKDWLGWQPPESVLSFRKTLGLVPIVLIAVILSGPVQWLRTGKPRSLPASVTAVTPWRLGLELRAGPEERGKRLPGLALALKANYPQGFQGRVLAGEGLDGFLLWALPDNPTPLLFYRLPGGFPSEHWEECVQALSAEEGWWEILDRFEVNLVVIDPTVNPALAEQLRKGPGWLVFGSEEKDPNRRDPTGRLIVALREGRRP
jgi:hypothetical protein